MTETRFFGDTLDIKYKTSDGSSLLVGISKGVEIKTEWDHVELYGQGSIKRNDVARTNLKIAISCSVASFHPNVLGKILGSETADSTISTGGDSTGRTVATVADNNKVPLFQVTGTVTGQDDKEMIVEVDGVYWENAPWNAPEGGWMQLDLSGYGRDIKLEYETT